MSGQRALINQCEQYLRAIGKIELADQFKTSRGFCFALFVAQRLAIEFEYETQWEKSLQFALEWDGDCDKLDAELSWEKSLFLPDGVSTLRAVFDFIVKVMIRHQSETKYQADFDKSDKTGKQVRYFYQNNASGLTRDLQGRPITVKVHGASVETFSFQRFKEMIDLGVKISPCLHVRNSVHACGIYFVDGSWCFYNSTDDVVYWTYFATQTALILHCLKVMGANLVIEPFIIKLGERNLRPISPAMDRFRERANLADAPRTGTALILLSIYNPALFHEYLARVSTEQVKEILQALLARFNRRSYGFEVILCGAPDVLGGVIDLAMRETSLAVALCDRRNTALNSSQTWFQLLIKRAPDHSSRLVGKATVNTTLAQTLQRQIISRTFPKSLAGTAMRCSNEVLARLLTFLASNINSAKAVCDKWKITKVGFRAVVVRCFFSHLNKLRSNGDLVPCVSLASSMLELIYCGCGEVVATQRLLADRLLANKYLSFLLDNLPQLRRRLVDALMNNEINHELFGLLVKLDAAVSNKIFSLLNVDDLYEIIINSCPPKALIAFIFSQSTHESEGLLAALLKKDLSVFIRLLELTDTQAEKSCLIETAVKLICSGRLTPGAVKCFAGYSSVKFNALFPHALLNQAVSTNRLTRANVGSMVQIKRGLNLLGKLLGDRVAPALKQQLFINYALRTALSDIFYNLYPRVNGLFFSAEPIADQQEVSLRLTQLNRSCSEANIETFLDWFRQRYMTEGYIPLIRRVCPFDEPEMRGKRTRRLSLTG